MGNLNSPFSHSANSCSDPERAPETSGGIVALCSIMVYKDRIIAAIKEEGTAEFSGLIGCFHPTRCLRIEIPHMLQFLILAFCQNFNTHGLGHINCVVLWSVFFLDSMASLSQQTFLRPWGLSDEQSTKMYSSVFLS